jgi:transcriptional regulator with XRE-family HTH domain
MAHTAASALREARTSAGLSRRALASRAGVPTSTVSRIESEQNDPTVAMLERLLVAAGSRLTLEFEPLDDQPTLAELATAVNADGKRLKIDWTRLRGFADWAARHPDEVADAIADPPARTSTPLDAILASFAEELADQCALSHPRWTRAIGPLTEPWAPPGTPRMRAEAEVSTPRHFRRRNLLVARSALFRPAA